MAIDTYSMEALGPDREVTTNKEFFGVLIQHNFYTLDLSSHGHHLSFNNDQ